MKIILIVEDELQIQEDIRMVLELEGYQTMGANNGKDALDQVQASKPHFILSDVFMPQMDGYGLLKALKSDPQYRHIPFVFLSAKYSEEDVAKGLAAGANAYLGKPFSSKDLIQLIESLINETED